MERDWKNAIFEDTDNCIYYYHVKGVYFDSVYIMGCRMSDIPKIYRKENFRTSIFKMAVWPHKE